MGVNSAKSSIYSFVCQKLIAMSKTHLSVHKNDLLPIYMSKNLSCVSVCLSVCLSVCYHSSSDLVRFNAQSKVRGGLFLDFNSWIFDKTFR